MVTPDLSLAAAALPADLEHHDTHGLRPRLHYVATGAGAPVLLLHGFPDFWFGWRHQLGPLAAGYRVVAPDQRGYNRSDKPRAVGAYCLDALADDVLRLADAVAPGQPITLVGHDWGAVVAGGSPYTTPSDCRAWSSSMSRTPRCCARTCAGTWPRCGAVGMPRSSRFRGCLSGC